MRNHRTRMVTLANLSVQSRHQVLRMALSIAIGLILATILIVSTSERPFTSLNYFFFAPIQKVSYLNFWIQKAVPLMFTGVAVCIMFSANQFNLAMEGSFLMGGFIGGALTNIYIFPNNHLLGIIFGCIIGGLVGSVVTAIPAILQKLFNASVMVTSLMMNYICLWYSCFLLFSVFKDPKTSKGTYSWTESGEEIMVARLKVGNDKLLIFYSLFVALLIVLFAWFLLYRTKFGFKLRTVGQNGHFVKYVGIPFPESPSCRRSSAASSAVSAAPARS
ncbi:MAG: ABC transporter permease [Erysipelotrichaceae bacterium]|nr:ABC transporter permease [Erysipelotrichaceae bacterium]